VRGFLRIRCSAWSGKDKTIPFFSLHVVRNTRIISKNPPDIFHDRFADQATYSLNDTGPVLLIYQ